MTHRHLRHALLAFTFLAPSGAQAVGHTFAPPPKFALEINQQTDGFLRDFEGGDVTADVIEAPGVPAPKKQAGPPKYGEFTLPLELSHGRAMDWIAEAWNGNSPAKNVVVSTCDANIDTANRQFTGVRLTEVTFPDLDASSKDAGRIYARFRPEKANDLKPLIGKCKAPAAAQPAIKRWLQSHFKFELTGLPANRTHKIDAFTVTLSSGPDTSAVQPTFPMLRVTLSAVDAQAWKDWHEDVVMKGNTGDDREREGGIVILAPNMRDELLRMDLHNVGIVGFRRLPSPEGGSIERVQVDLYVERMNLTAP